MNRREQILNNALKDFNKYGYYQTSISNIAEESGISKSTFFHYFKTKEELAEELFIHCKEIYLNQPVTAFINADISDEEIYETYMFAYEHLEELKYMFMMETSDFISDDVKKTGASMYERCTTEIIKAQREGRMIDLDCHLLYVFMMNIVISSADKIYKDNSVDIEYLKKIVYFIQHALCIK